ncbi:transporter substrate-binding domain-containing protein [Pantoea alhagi]|uniref:hybrid sensor histidine kinase/response regulator n=1 Tax=Pantoea alhagi TaxID=1891675 RepID=UPI00202B6CF2|nr:ATP-binding protein [Pantoea alhagi]URQ61906.1 transporter substrate-binding domain-containing protein [Pantoea alhagi]
MESSAIARLLLLLALLLSLPATAAWRPVSSMPLPQELMMPGGETVPWQGKTLRVGVLQASSAPWNMFVGKDLYGINADYLVALGNLTGARFAINSYPTNAALLDALRQGKEDLAFGIPRQAIADDLYATRPWFSTPLRIYRSRQNHRPVMFNSQEARIAVSASTLQQIDPEFAHRHRWETYSSDLQALYTLFNRQNDYVVADETSAGFLLSQLQQGEIYQIASTLEPGELSLYAVTPQVALRDALNQAIRQLPVEVINGIQGRWSMQLPRYSDTNTLHLTAMEKAWLKQHPQVVYSALTDNYPWSYRSASGEARGYSVDLLNAIGQSTGLRFTPLWVNNPQQARERVSTGQALIELVQPLTGSDDMESSTLPVWRALWGVYVGALSPNVIRWQDLQGKRVGIRRGDLALQLLPEGVTVQPFDDAPTLYNALANGQLDAVVDNVLSARWLIQSRYGEAVRFAFAASDIAWPIAMGVNSQQPLLRAILDKGLQQIPPDTQQRMRAAWSNENQPGSADSGTMRPVILTLLVLALAAILLLLALLVRRWRQQRQEAQQRLRLEQEREAAEQANRMKSQFIASVSHELRTPMQAILGLLELELAHQPQTSRLRLIHSSATSLMSLLNDLQDHARIENNTFSLQPVPLDLQQWLEDLSRFWSPLMRTNGPAFNVKALSALPRRVLLDSGRLQQIATNLISNALKFTAQGTITLTLSTTDSELTLCVADSGCGIPADEQARLFEPWYQTPSGRARSVQGSGLGLSICREIARRMGGDIMLHSQPGQGTRVTVTLPLTFTSEAPLITALSANNPSELQHLTIAVVDDHPTNLLVMQQQLNWLGAHVQVFAEGRALLRAAQSTRFDIILIDYNMPHPDGPTVARILRRRERGAEKRTRLIYCSADVQLLQHPEVWREADEVILKPVSLTALRTLLTSQPATQIEDKLEQQLWQLANRDAAFLPRVITTLRQTLQEDSAAIQQALDRQDWAQLEKHAHRMKGSWLLLGIDEGKQLCQQLGTQAQARQACGETSRLLLLLIRDLLARLETYDASSFTPGT